MQIESAHAFTSSKRYVIERELGHGGMGVVYQALDLERNTRVALKALTQRDAVNIYRLKNEFRQLADLSHPNLVTLHELCNEGNALVLHDGARPRHRRSTSTSAANAPTHAATIARGVQTRRRPLVRDVVDHAEPARDRQRVPARARDAATSNACAARCASWSKAWPRCTTPASCTATSSRSNVLVTPEGRVVVLDFGLVSSARSSIPSARRRAHRRRLHVRHARVYVAGASRAAKPSAPPATGTRSARCSTKR